MPKRLTQEDKQEILELYRNTNATTSTLAQSYQVSSSTISRFLQKTLPHEEYEELIQLKRLARTQKPHEKTTLGSVKPKPVLSQQNSEAIPQTLTSTEKPTKSVELNVTEDENEDEDFDVIALGEMLGEDLEDNDGDWDEDWQNDAELVEEDSEEVALTGDKAQRILPLSKAMFPKVCYVVIGRGAELIVRPLKEFHYLGEIPKSELRQQTLPVFTNYRVARRFSNRFQRVIKIPNGSLLLKTSSHLLAKGINYLFLDNHLYSLVS